MKSMNPNNNQAYPPFSCQYSAQVPELLTRLNCSLAISTYQAGKLIFLSPKDENSVVQLPRHFDKVMGIAHDTENDKLALACRDEVIVFANSRNLAKSYPKSPNKYDSLYLPRNTFHTGALDIHDLNFGANGELYGVNTLFSNIIKIDSNFNFTPYWTPPFIDEMVSEDRCHLNGMAFANGKPKFVSAFNQGNTMQSWRENITKTGVLMDIDTNEVIVGGLAMPHSPRVFGDDLYVLLSATGELVRVDVQTGKYDVVVKLNGFVRGMSLHQEYLFIGLSKLRENSSTFGKLSFAKNANQAGITIVHLPTGSIVGKISYLSSLDEIYDVHVLPDTLRPNIMNTRTEDYKESLMTPSDTFWAVKK